MGTQALDVGLNAGVWRAPEEGTVTLANRSAMCEWDPGFSRGGEVVFQTNNGVRYLLLHADPLVRAGTSVPTGTPIATISTGLPPNRCWTGAHYHLEVRASGAIQNSLNWYNGLGCGIVGC